MDGAVVKVALVFPKESHVIQKLAAVNLVDKSEIPLRSEVEEESQAVVIRSNGFVAYPLLVLASKNLKFRKPVEYGVGNFCPGGFLLFNNGDACVDSIEICLLLRACIDCCIEVVAGGLPGRVPSGREYLRK